MNREVISDALEQIDSRYIDEAAVFERAGRRLKARYAWIAVAACLTVLLASIPFAGGWFRQGLPLGETTSGSSSAPTSAQPSSPQQQDALIFSDMPVYLNLASLVEAAEFIVVGRTVGEPEAVTDGLNVTTVHTFAVEESVKGDLRDAIKLFEPGQIEPDGQDIENEIHAKRDTSYVLFLSENHTRPTAEGREETLYISVGAEQGYFEIDQAGRLHPYAGYLDEELTGMTVDELVQKIRSLA
ncbi:MAG: hypothetical protein E7541_05140 [Ruminococcaceae bacterium]|nr:hypothetical protein [Oscillospiraceae bacterium]